MTPRETAIKRITDAGGTVAAVDDVRSNALAWYGPVRAPTVHRVRV